MSLQSRVAGDFGGQALPAPAEPTGKAPMPTVLIVDDEAIVREVVADYLRKDGFRVESAADGHEALSRFAAARPDLVL
ncbi:MAG TPA: response regulator, partial [Thermomicrobiales bacterium]|nr:response regulator [Thermomicrobiales bacterium]